MALGLGLGLGIHPRPGVVPALSFDFEHMGSLPTELAFTRGTAAMAWDDSLVLASYATNVPALARAIPSGRRGLVMQGARTNLCPYSSDLRDTTDAGASRPWVYGQVGVTPNAGVASDGTTTADLVTESIGTAQHFIRLNVATTAAAHVVSCVAKLGTGTRLLSIYPQGTTSSYAVFNLETGAVTLTGGGADYLGSGIESIGGGRYKCWVSWTASAVTTACVFYLSDGLQAPSYNGTGSSIYISDVQCEAGTFPSMSIATNGGTASRSADLCTHTLSAALAAALSTQGTMVVEWTPNSSASSIMAACSVDDGTAANRNLTYRYATGTAGLTAVSSSDRYNQGLTQAINATGKIGYRWKVDDCRAALNGSLAAADVAPSAMPTVTKVGIGCMSGGGNEAFAVIHKVWIFTHAMTDAELEAATA